MLPAKERRKINKIVARIPIQPKDGAADTVVCLTVEGALFVDEYFLAITKPFRNIIIIPIISYERIFDKKS